MWLPPPDEEDGVHRTFHHDPHRGQCHHHDEQRKNNMGKINGLRLPPCGKQFTTMRRMQCVHPLPVLVKLRFQTHHHDASGGLETGSHPFDVFHSTGHHTPPCESTRVAVGGVLENHPVALEVAILTLPLTGLPSNRHVRR